MNKTIKHMGHIACVLKSKFTILFFLSTLIPFFAIANPNKEQSLFYKAYLSKGELNANLVCHGFFLEMTPEQINNAINDIRKFIQEEVIANINKIDEFFIKRILHIHGHIIMFIEEAWVHKKTKKLVRARPKNVPAYEFISLMKYWQILENSGVKIHYHKFFASCIDYLAMLLRAYFSYQCTNYQKLDEVNYTWMYWMGRISGHISDNAIFGGYYSQNLILFKEIYRIWEEDFNKNEALHKKNNNYNEQYYENNY